MICPKDGTPCCDDLCYGSGCMEMGGYPMLRVCDVCQGTIDEENSDCGTCTCDGDEDEEEWLEQISEHCLCCSQCGQMSPCGGVMAGGLCDQLCVCDDIAQAEDELWPDDEDWEDQ